MSVRTWIRVERCQHQQDGGGEGTENRHGTSPCRVFRPISADISGQEPGSIDMSCVSPLACVNLTSCISAPLPVMGPAATSWAARGSEGVRSSRQPPACR